ncbi:MAG: MBL fold metallo-hydrolase [Coprobacillus sp.]|nr:MBL fold metallo-hydrolase [Coprobacillus sp.]
MDITITYLGHSSFKVSDSHSSLVIDPYEDGSVPGLSFPKGVEANKVLVSHEHADHNATSYVSLIPQPDFDIEVSSIDCFHDDKHGALRGPNKIHILKIEDTTLVHLGDLGHDLDEEVIKKLGDVTILFAPINGHFTLGSEAIFSLYQKINPKIIIPMHYYRKDDGSGYPDDNEIDKFLSHFKSDSVLKVDKSFNLESVPKDTKVIIF